MAQNLIPKEERRKYRRLDTIIPVEFQIIDAAEPDPHAPWHQAYSHDVSAGGLCCTVNHLSAEEIAHISSHHTQILLRIHIPFGDKSFLIPSVITWVRQNAALPFSQHGIGVAFSEANNRHIQGMLRRVVCKKVAWRFLEVLILCLLLFVFFVFVNNTRLRSKNIALLQQFSQLIEREVAINKKQEIIIGEKNELTNQLSKGGLESKILTEKIAQIEETHDNEILSLQQKIEEFEIAKIGTEQDLAQFEQAREQLSEAKKLKRQEMGVLEQDMIVVNRKQKILSAQLEVVAEQESLLKGEGVWVNDEQGEVKENIQFQFLHWMQVHQNQRTGLVSSFEGDQRLKDVAFTYDQALAAITFSFFGETKRAQKILDFYSTNAERLNGGFANAYYGNVADVAEYIAHAGPNLWIGIAALQYTVTTKDQRFMPLARQIAQWVISLQDAEGGIRGGRKTQWQSTEHNLDGFSFFTMLHEITRDAVYKETADKILVWLQKYAYGNKPVPINRGKGDATIATDTYAWSIAALGAKRLQSIDMDPEAIVQFAEEHCSVTVPFTTYFGDAVEVQGFDFAKNQNSARGGVVSCEWTAQMILSYKLLSTYFVRQAEMRKAKHYETKALQYLGELTKMIVSSKSAFGQGRWCLPYASAENVDTGHGWRTPQGSNTGSVASTAYAIFAIEGFNPLSLDEHAKQ